MPTYTVTDPASGRTLTLTGDSPPTEQELEDIFAQAGGGTAKPADPYANDSAWDLSGERTIFGAGLAAAKAPARGFANTILGSVEGTAELLDAATNFVGLDSLIDSGDENAAVWAANAGKDWINKESGAKIDPRYQDLWSTKFGEGVGSFASFLTPSLALKALSGANKLRAGVEAAETIGKLSRAEKVATGAFAAATGAGEAAQRAKGAREEGLDVTEGQEDFATAQGALVGLTEMLPISRIFGRVPKNIPIGEKDYLLNMFKSAGLAAAEEGTQEVGAAILQNMIERGYNPNQEIIEGSLMDDLTIGAGVGALADIALNAFAGRRKGYMSAAQIENERKAREIESRNHFQYQQEVAERGRLNELIRTDPQAFAAESEKVQALASTIPAPSNEEVAAFNQPSMAGPVVTPASVGELYALRIVGGLGSYFPTNTSFKVEQGEDIAAPVVGPDGTETTVPQPTFKVVDSTGKQYGQTLTNPDIASSLANNLNGEIVGQSVRGSILNTLMTSPQAYDPAQTSGLFRYGYQTLNPESNTVTYAALNDAADTTTENGYIEEVSYKDILKSPRVLVKAGKNKNLKSVNDLKLVYEVVMPDGKKRLAVGLTAAQELNRKREEAGLPEVNAFNIREARNALGGNIGSISNPSVSGINDQLKYSPVMLNGKPAVISQANEVLTQRKTTFAEKAAAGFKQDGTSVLPDYIEFQSEADAKRYANTLNNRKADKRYVPEELFAGKTDLYKELNQLLKSKNIDATLESPEIEQLVKSFTGARDAKSMSLEDQKLFYARLRNLPGFSTQTKLPVFRVRPYAPEQFVAATQYQNQNPGAVTDEGLAQAVGLSPTDPKIAAIKADLQRQTDRRLQKEAADTANMPLVQGLQKALDGFGLSGINLRLSQTLTAPGATDQNEGYFDAQMNELALAVDAIVGENLTDEQRLNQLKSVLSHESVHAAKFLDLWTAKEWDILSQAAQRTLRPEGMDGAGTTFLAYAQRMYPDMSPDIQVEESIAELARAFIDNRKLIGGKPRNLIERLIRFFQRMASFVNASGYQTFESILDDFRTGKIGARERGVVRTLRLTKNVPEGYMVAEDVPEGVETRTISDFDEAALEGADIRESRKPIDETDDNVTELIPKPLRDFHRDMMERVQERSIQQNELINSYDWRFAIGQRVMFPEQSPLKGKVGKVISYFVDTSRSALKKNNGIPSPKYIIEVGEKDTDGYSVGTYPADKVDDYLIPFGPLKTVRSDIRESRKPIVNVEERNKAFENLAQSQRGAPEIAMLRAQDALYNLKDPSKAGQEYQQYESSGMYSNLLEHVGDITHRMSEMPDMQPNLGLELVTPKVMRSIERLRNPIDLKNMSKIPSIPETVKYSEEHSKLEVFNEMQKAAKDAAVALGNKQFDLVRENLQKIADAIADGSYSRIAMEYNPDIRYSRKSSQSPIEDAIALANEKHADFKTRSEKEFFTHWQKLLKTVGNQLAPTPGSIRIAAKKAINDMDAWLKDNPRYADYYENDMQAVKEVLEGRFGAVSDEEMSLFQALNGLTSPNTKLKSNVADALNLFSLYREDGNFDGISLGWSEKGNNVLMYSPVRISGTSAGNKARAVKIIDQIIKEQGSIEKAMKFLHGSVTMPQLHAFKRSLGYKSNVSGVGPIKALVKNATGQDTMIPRMFIFGKKVGAYTLNLTGNHKYTTIDIWESRFIRSYFNDLFQKNTGLPVDAFEHDLFSRFNELFKEEFDKLTGKDWEPSALQAMRWFYILNAANKAGYKGASTNDTISEYARKQIQSAGVRSGQGRGLGDEAARRYSRKPNRFYSESLVAFVRPNRASNGTASLPYARGSGRDGANVRILNNDVAVAKSYIPSQEFKNIVTGLEQEAKPFYELAPDQKSAETFRDAISLFKSLPENKYRAAVYVYPVEDYAGMRLFLTESGKTGFALKPDGDIVSVFSYEQGGRSAMELAIQSGGRKLDCFDTVLPDFYASHLFSEAGRVKWDDSQAPDDWDKEVFKKFNNGEPDVVMMVYDPVGTMLTKEAPQMEYGEALDAQSRMQVELSPPADDGAMPTSLDQTTSNATQAQLDDAVAKAAKDTARTPATSIALYGPNASPEALYVAQNPEMGAKLSVDDKKRYSRRGNEPQYPPNIQKLIDQTPSPADETMGQTLVKNLQMGSLKDAIDSMRQAFIFRGARLERQYKENPELARMMADTSAIAAMEMADHARSLTQAAITGGIPVYENGGFKVVPFVYKGKTIERGLLEVMAPLNSEEHGNLERLAHRYAMAVRGERLNNEGKLTPIAPGELQALEAEIQKYRNPATGQPVVKEWYDMWQAYNANIVRYLQKTGIIDDAGAQLWMKQADYIPFYRENADGTLMHPKVFGGLHTAGQFKAVGKSSADLNVDMVTAIVNNIDAAIAMGIKNVAQQRIIRDQMNLGLASVLKQGETVGDRHSVSFKINGKRYTAIIEDPLIYQSMLPASEIPMDGLFGTMFRIPANVLRELIIRDPGYMLANMFRDTLSTYVTTGAEVIPLWGTAKGFTGDIEKLRNLGVIGGYDLRMDKFGVRKFYDKEAKKMGMVAGINWLNPVTAAWEVMGRISERSEAATRLAVYEDVLKRTGNEVEAQYQALSVMNYGRRGNNALLRMTTAMVPFLNARIQGLDKLYQAATGRESAIYKKDAAGKVVPEIQRRKNFGRFVFRAGLIMAVTAMYYAMVSDEDEYENASPEVRDNYYILPVIKGDTETGEPGLSVRLPIPFEVGILFKVIPERLIAGIYGDDTSKDFKDSMKRALFSTLAINPTPQAVLPIGEAMLNKDTYTGRPIIPYYMEHLLPEQQKTFYTSKFAEQVANSLGASPMKVEHVMQGYGGTLGGYFLQAIDSAMRSGGDQKPAMAWYQYPFIKRFFTTANQPGLQNKFYELKNDVDGITQTINKLTEEGRYDELAAFYAKNGHMYELRKDLNYLEKQITALREQRKMIEQMDISPETKREQVEQINMMISAMLVSVPMYRKAAYEPE